MAAVVFLYRVFVELHWTLQLNDMEKKSKQPMQRTSSSLSITIVDRICWSFIPQHFFPLMNSIPINLKFLLLTHTTPSQSSVLFLPALSKYFLSPAISFFRALKPTFSLFLTLHDLSAVRPSALLLDRPVLTGLSSPINATKHLIIHHHLLVLVWRRLYKLLLYFTLQ